MTGDLSETENELLTEVRKMVTLGKDREKRIIQENRFLISLVGAALFLAGFALGAYFGYQQGAAYMLAFLMKSGMLISGVVP